jgi:cell division protein FtsB
VIVTRSRVTVMLTIATLVIAAALFTNFLPFRQILAQQRALDLTRTQLEVLREENTRLEQEVTALMTDAEVERLAREYFGYVMPGEQAIVVVSPSEERRPAAEPASEQHEHTWWQAFWDFLTGRDLVE